MSNNEIMVLRLDSIEPDPQQPRSEKTGDEFDEYIESLSRSIEADGLNNPIHVRPHPADPDKFMIVNGECRWRAHMASATLRQAGTIPAMVKEFSEDKDLVMNQILDNEARRDLSPMAKVRSYQSALDRGATVEELAAKLGRNVGTIRKDIALLELPSCVLAGIEQGKTSKKVAGYILATFPPDEVAAGDKQTTVWKKSLNAKNFEAAKTAIDLYRMEIDQTKLPGEEEEEEPKADTKTAMRVFSNLQKFQQAYDKSGVAPLDLVRTVNRNKRQTGGLTAIEESIRWHKRMIAALEEGKNLFAAQSGLTGTDK